MTNDRPLIRDSSKPWFKEIRFATAITFIVLGIIVRATGGNKFSVTSSSASGGRTATKDRSGVRVYPGTAHGHAVVDTTTSALKY